ncbi:hypothetical protein [Acidithiobacillus thiooxidans]|jgi:hypothetical protein|uniref:Uncharacterized protein n=1 Tax=Acidithiobacillus thiooxidans ATCC 19377 TaxID=637390 RepID=A0A543Q2C7_ACITH|nr:hypothetical protein [Acidithiobacillus thiooxidans]MDX5935424.1 hypothetical protein [Acidithiobacillus thiooxidans]TQN50440.1 hypothetical protein DLNHIDIE_00293 [Acidithiobacillus thiooxidans ATCC 19377]
MDAFNALLYAALVLCSGCVGMTAFIIYMGERQERQRKIQHGSK